MPTTKTQNPKTAMNQAKRTTNPDRYYRITLTTGRQITIPALSIASQHKRTRHITVCDFHGRSCRFLPQQIASLQRL